MTKINPGTEDFLGRNPVAINLHESLNYLRGKRVLVTGAGGSIGSEISRQLLPAGTAKLYLFGHGENSIYQIDRELRLPREDDAGEKAVPVPIIGDLKDRDYIDWLLGKLKADVIFHTAAYKHVPLMEENPVAAIENNLFGMDNLIAGAKKHGVKRFVHISTDKAVEPISVYGASKFLCERLVLQKDSGNSSFMAVRFGNVLGSRGSIVPLFRRQIEKGGPVTITHPDMKRWFMTIPEACSLVLKAGGVGENGGLYLLDMGEPVRIRGLAEQMIRSYGLEPEKDIGIVYTGLRPGERLDEKLLWDFEKALPTDSDRILRVMRNEKHEIDMDTIKEKLKPVCRLDPSQPEKYRDSELLLKILREQVILGEKEVY